MGRPGSLPSGFHRLSRGVSSPPARRSCRPAWRAAVESLERRTLMSAADPLDAAVPQPETPPAETAPASVRPPDAPGVAVSLDEVNYYSPAWVFNDAFKAAMPWVATAVEVGNPDNAGRWGQGGAVATDANGWPTALATWTDDKGKTWRQRLETLMFRDIGGQYPAGQYTVQWEGSGRLSFGAGAKVVSSDANTIVLNVKPSQQGINLRIDDMDPANPVRNIHVWMPDYAGQSFVGRVWHLGDAFSPFHPEFVNRLRGARAIRFMDWGETNGSQLVTWDQRRTVDMAFQGAEDKRGVAYEYMIELCNEVGADAWLNIPHQADPDFVRNLATLFRDHLNAGLRVNLEWSNEIWNTAGGFKTFSWLQQQQQNVPEFAGKSEFAVAAAYIQRDFDIFEDVWGQTGQQDRLTRVVAGQAGNGWVLEDLLKNMDGKFDAVAVGGYVNTSNADGYDAHTTGEQVARDVRANVAGAIGGLYRARQLADTYAARLGRDIQLFAYEGGQALVANNAPYQQAYFDAQDTATMYQAYEDLFQGFYQIGGDLFTHFTFVSPNGSHGSWGSLRYMTQPTEDSPKYRAIEDAISGALFRPEFKIEATQPVALERGTLAAQFTVTRFGDKREALDVPLSLSGSADASDYAALPASLHFEPGEVSKTIDLVPADDAAAEVDESVVVALGPGAGYAVDDQFGAARVTIVDDDGYDHADLRVKNGDFAKGFDGWAIGGDDRFGIADHQVSNAPDGGHGDGDKNYAWTGGASGSNRGGGLSMDLLQKIDLKSHAKEIQDGGARITVTVYGAGGGVALDNASVELRFFDKPGGGDGKQLGDAVTSAAVFTEGHWTAMVADAEVPRGARGVEVRLIGRRRSGDLGMNVGFDDVSAVLHVPQPGARPDVQQSPPDQQEQAPAQPPPTPTGAGDVGSPPITGQTAVVAPGSAYDLTGAAGDVAGTSDNFHYAYQQRTGDFDIRVRVAAISGADNTASAGLMARAALDPSSASFFVELEAGRARATIRKAASATAKSAKGKPVTMDADGSWLRLRRTKNTFTGYRSDDGGKWKKISIATLKSIGTTVYFGLAAASGTADATTQVQFRDLGETPAPPGKGRRLATGQSAAGTVGLAGFVPLAATEVVDEAKAA